MSISTFYSANPIRRIDPYGKDPERNRPPKQEQMQSVTESEHEAVIAYGAFGGLPGLSISIIYNAADYAADGFGTDKNRRSNK